MSAESKKYEKSDVLEAIRKLVNEGNYRTQSQIRIKLLKQYPLTTSKLRRYILELGIEKTPEGFYKLPDEVMLRLQRTELSSLLVKADLEIIKDPNLIFLSVKPGYIELLIHEFRNHSMLNNNIISMIPSPDGILVIVKDLVEFNREIKKIKNIND